MNCSNYQENITAYLYNELDLPQAMALHQHLGRCQDCTRQEMELRQALKVVADYEYNPLPADFNRQLQTRLSRIVRHRKALPLGKRHILYAVAATLVLMIGMELLVARYLPSFGSEENLMNFSTVKPAFQIQKDVSISLSVRQSEFLEKYQRYVQKYQSTVNDAEKLILPVKKHGHAM